MKHIYKVIIFVAMIIVCSMHNANAWIIVNSPFGDLNNFFWKYQYQPKLAKGFANASAYSAHVATQRGFQGYDTFAITLGTMGAAQVPATTTNLSYYKHLAQKLYNQGDVYVGAAWNAWSLNAGVKLPGDVYLSAKFGKLIYSYQDYDFNGTHVGGMINYQVVKPIAPTVKIVLWRGLSIGAGYLWQMNTTAYEYKGRLTTYGPVILRPQMKITARTASHVIPLEISTAVRLFWFLNIHAGGGIDFAWGSSQLRYSGMGLVASGAGSGLYVLYGKQAGTGPTHFLPKIFCGPGLSLGPVIVDLPFTYYFNGGFNAGVTLGVLW